MSNDERETYPSRAGARSIAARQVMIDALLEMRSPKTADALQYRTEFLLLFNAIGAGVNYFSVYLHRSTDIIPATQLTDGQNIPWFQANICTRIAGHGPFKIDVVVLGLNFFASIHNIACQISSLFIGTALEASCKFYQRGSSHSS